MKSIFQGFYSVPESTLRDIWGDDSTLFIFDTNCLLNLYRCEEHTRVEILNVMRAISSRSWIPFQVGFEYQKNRRVTIEESISSLKKIKSELEGIYTKNILGGVKKQLNNALNEDVIALQDNLKKSINEFIKEKIDSRIKNKESISNHDFIRESIDSIINDNIGCVPTQERINEIDKDGEIRYANKIPPGFRDVNKKDISYFADIKFQNKYGDLYLWKEIIDKSKSGHIKNVIFISDDNKEDWWFTHSGKTHGPLESLKTEICINADIKNFKLINQLTFLHEAKKYLTDVEVSEASLKEVEELTIITSELDKLKKYNKNDFLNNQMLKDESDINKNHLLYDFTDDVIEVHLKKSEQNLINRVESIFHEFQILNSKTLYSLINLKKIRESNSSLKREKELDYCIESIRVKRAELINLKKEITFRKNMILSGDMSDYDDILIPLEQFKTDILTLKDLNSWAKDILNDA